MTTLLHEKKGKQQRPHGPIGQHRNQYRLYLLYADCEKEQDKAFGLWSLAMSCCQTNVPVDYSLSLKQVAKQVLGHQQLHHRHTPGSFEGPQGDIWDWCIVPRAGAHTYSLQDPKHEFCPKRDFFRTSSSDFDI
jgi:hypothetical protein